MQPANLLDFDHAALTAWFGAADQKAYRARQVLRWMHRRGATDFTAMTDIARSLRAWLQEHARIVAPTVLRDLQSTDGTRKWLRDVGAGNAI